MTDDQTLLNTLFANLENFLRTETVFGTPVEIGNVKLVPIIEVGFGAGVGGGNGKDHIGSYGDGGGAGTGGKISPCAVVVIRDGDVSLLKTKDNSSWDNIIDLLPDLVTKMQSCCERNK